MPAGPPPPGPPEYLQQGAGYPLPPSGGTSGRRKALIAGGAIVGLGAATAVAFGAMWYFGTGPQPAEALPDSTIGYVSIDIDPSGQQLLEARETLEKFPAWNDQGISGKKDLREAVFDEVLADAPCELDYNDDIEPWLGDRAAAAAVDLGEDEPTPVLVVQVKDADKAEAAFQKFNECEPEAEGQAAGWAISGEWAVLAETEDIATQVAEDAKDKPLSEDDDFKKWTDEAGDTGILTAYAAPEAGKWLAENAGGFMGMGLSSEGCVSEPVPPDSDLEGVDPFETYCDESSAEEMPDEVTEILEDFSGAALTVRFDDGALEVETATSVEGFGFEALTSSDQAGESIETLPEDTAAAIAYGFEEGWFEDFLEYAEASSGMGDLDELLAEAEAELGLDLPEDAETLAGESAVLALGADFDPAFFESDASITELPVGLKIKGDPDAIQDVIDKILDSEVASEEDAELFVSDSEGDFVAIGPNEDYRQEILEDGDLGGSDTYENVVRESDDAASILYVNFDAGGGWLEEIFAGDDELQENIAPLEGAGVSAWADDGVGHVVLRVTTE
jgi:hypothetical protein